VGHRHGGGGRFFSHRGGGFGAGDEDFSRGRKFSSEDLQMLLVALLVDAPRYGYELIKLLESRSNGFYTPSPGMVYPALTYLEEIGYTTVESEGNRKRYALTTEGHEYFAANREQIELLWAKLSFFARKMGMVRRALAGEEGDEYEESPPQMALMKARMKLKKQLFAHSNGPEEEQSRIAEVLERAAAEIAAIVAKNPKA
jgi:DNA-binding PadR family transcriptional regulator